MISRIRLSKGALDFKQFLLRRQVLNLYREALRLIREEPSIHQQNELKQWTRYEFESKKDLQDPGAIKMQLSKGHMMLKEIAAAIRMAK